MLASWGKRVYFLRVSAPEVCSCSVGCPVLMHIQAMLSRLSGFKRREYMGWEGKVMGGIEEHVEWRRWEVDLIETQFCMFV